MNDAQVVRLTEVLFECGYSDRKERVRAFVCLAQDPPDISGAIRFCKEIAERGWSVLSLWWPIALIIEASAVANLEQYGFLFKEVKAVLGQKFENDRGQRIFLLGAILGLFSGAAKGWEAGFNPSMFFIDLFRLAYFRYSEKHLEGDDIYEADNLRRYEERLSQAIKALVRAPQIDSRATLQATLQAKLVVTEARSGSLQPSRLGTLILELLSYALFGPLSTEEKIQLVTHAGR